MELNPKFQETNYGNFQKAEGNFGFGKNGDKIRDINSAMGHMGTMWDATNALQNGDVQLLNRIANSAGAAVGSTPAQTYKAIVHAVGPELTKVYITGSGTKEDRKTVEGDFSEALPPEQLRKNIQARAKLLSTVIGSTAHEYQNATYGRGRMHANFFTPEALAQMEKVAPGAIRTLTRDQIQQWANQHANGDLEEARKRFADSGIFMR
jgi:hypothetical protein